MRAPQDWREEGGEGENVSAGVFAAKHTHTHTLPSSLTSHSTMSTPTLAHPRLAASSGVAPAGLANQVAARNDASRLNKSSLDQGRTAGLGSRPVRTRAAAATAAREGAEGSGVPARVGA